ncbi:hypothetical protein VTH06DRAFT_4214 [Thermothelomyces fergusii]
MSPKRNKEDKSY